MRSAWASSRQAQLPADPRASSARSRLRSLAVSANLDPGTAEKFLNFIVKEAIRHHEEIQRRESG